MYYQDCPFAAREVWKRLSVCISHDTFTTRNFLRCVSGRTARRLGPEIKRERKVPTHSSSSSEIDSNDEVLPWLLLLLLDPPPEEPIKGDGFVV